MNDRTIGRDGYVVESEYKLNVSESIARDTLRMHTSLLKYLFGAKGLYIFRENRSSINCDV